MVRAQDLRIDAWAGVGTVGSRARNVAPQQSIDVNHSDEFGIIGDLVIRHAPLMSTTPRVEHCVERLCQKGCRQVWGYIDALQRGKDLPETRQLSAEERDLVLAELKAIMAVYGDRCSVD